jgi:hypothetical protein
MILKVISLIIIVHLINSFKISKYYKQINYSLSKVIKRWMLMLLLIISINLVLGATVSSHVFLNGTYIEVGISPNGAFGSSVSAPANFHPIGRNTLGFVADIGKDGWDVGSPAQSGDYFMPGSWEEGFVVEWNTVGERTYYNAGPTTQITTTTTLTETSSSNTLSAVWGGEVSNGNEKLGLTNTVSFDVNNSYFIINTVLTNLGTVTLNSVEFMRTVDPDNDKDIGGGYNTNNYIASNPNSTTNKSLVIAKGITYPNVVIGLGTIDSRASASPIASGITARDPDFPLDTPRTGCTASSPCNADIAIPLAFRLGTLSPGQSVSLDYAYILNENDLEIALSSIESLRILQPLGSVSGNNVLFQATTNDVPNTESIEFFINDVSIAVDTTPDFGSNFHTSFDSTSYSDGSLTIKIIANFSDGRSIQKISTITVANSGPPINFISPTQGQTFEGTGIVANISINEAHAPVRVSFFRETTEGSTFLEEDNTEPFSTTFDVDDLANGDTVIIKAVAYDSEGLSTTISVSGRVSTGNSFYNVPSGVTVSDLLGETLTPGESTYSSKQKLKFNYGGNKFAEVNSKFDEGDVDLANLKLYNLNNNYKKINVIDWSAVHEDENIEQTNHSLYVNADWISGAYACPHAESVNAVNPSCSNKVSFTHTQCLNNESVSGVICSYDGLDYKLEGLNGTGVAANGNANLTIYDSAEGSSAINGTNLEFFAEYVNGTSGDLISGSCQITFDDNIGVYYDMDEGVDKYNYTKNGGFSSVGSHEWSVNCSATNYNSVNVTDTISITDSSPSAVPEFSDYAIILILMTIIGGFVLKKK